MSTPAELKQQILASLQAQRAPTRAQRRRRLLGVLACSLLLLCAMGGRHGLEVLEGRPWLYNSVLTAVFGGVFFSLMRPLAAFARTPLGPARELLRRRVRVAVPALAFGTVLANLVAPETIQAPATTLWMYLPCILLALGTGLLVASLAFVWMRGSDPLTPRGTARAIAAAAGTAAAFAASVACPHVDPAHTLVSHVAPVGLTVLVAGALGARILRMSWPIRDARPNAEQRAGADGDTSSTMSLRRRR